MQRGNKTLEKVKQHRNVLQVWHEPENGWFAALKPGLECSLSGAPTCREDTLSDLLYAVRHAKAAS